jgi:hypothetical protein
LCVAAVGFNLTLGRHKGGSDGTGLEARPTLTVERRYRVFEGLYR